MYRVCSIFSRVLKLFSRGDFEKAVKGAQGRTACAGFTSWREFMAMLSCQLRRAQSLREICGGLACREGQLKHLGVPVAPKKSTLAYANENQPWELYQTVFEQTLFQCQELVASQGRKKFRFKNKLMKSLIGSWWRPFIRFIFEALMQIKYDKEADALYIRLLQGDFQCRVVRLTEDIALDFAASEKLVGIEVLGASRLFADPESPNIELEHLLPTVMDA